MTNKKLPSRIENQRAVLETLEARRLLSASYVSQVEPLPVGSGDENYVFIDLDDDGDLDIASARGGSLWLSRNLGSRRFGLPERSDWLGTIGTLAAGDVDGDGRDDLVSDGRGATGQSRVVRVFRQMSNGSLARPIPTVLAAGGSPLQVANLDSDAAVEVLLVGRLPAGASDQLHAFNVIDGRLSIARTFEQSMTPLIADIDGDGGNDLLFTDGFVSSANDGVISGTFEPLDRTAFASWLVVGVVDWNGDNLGDLVLKGSGPDPSGSNYVRIAVSLQSAEWAFTSPVVLVEVETDNDSVISASLQFVGTTEANDDGHPDLLVRHSSVGYGNSSDEFVRTGSLIIVRGFEGSEPPLYTLDFWRDEPGSRDDFGVERFLYRVADIAGNGFDDLIGDRLVRWSGAAPKPPEISGVGLSSLTPTGASRFSTSGRDPDEIRGGSIVRAEFRADTNNNGRLDADDLVIGDDINASDGFSADVMPGQSWARERVLIFARVQDNTGYWSVPAQTYYADPHPTVESVVLENRPRGRVAVGQSVTFVVSGLRNLTGEGLPTSSYLDLFIDTDGSGTVTATDVRIANLGRSLATVRRVTVTVDESWGRGQVIQVLAAPRSYSWQLYPLLPAEMTVTVLP